MIPKKALDLAFKGGWAHEKRQYYYWQMTACDPTFWIALGKQLGWEVEGADPFTPLTKSYAHRFYDLILTGQSVDEFWKEITG